MDAFRAFGEICQSIYTVAVEISIGICQRAVHVAQYGWCSVVIQLK